MKQNSTPFDVAEYDNQIKRTLPFYEEMVQQIVDIVRILNLQSFRWLDVEKEMLKRAENRIYIFLKILWVSYMQVGILARK